MQETAADESSCDVFLTHSDGKPVGREEFLLPDTKSWDHKEIKL